jgi:hypothetical protein
MYQSHAARGTISFFELSCTSDQRSCYVELLLPRTVQHPRLLQISACRRMPPVTWREKVGDIPYPGDQAGRRLGRKTFSLAGPVPEVFSSPEWCPRDSNPTSTRPRSASVGSLHKFPFRAPSRNPATFERHASDTKSRSSSQRSSSVVTVSTRPPQIDVELAKRVSLKGPGTPRDVTTLVHQVDSAVSARLDDVTSPVDAAAVMRRVPHRGLRSRFVDNGRNSMEPARKPVARSSVVALA